MRIRKLLLIHPKRAIRALIKKYIYSELADIEIQEAGDGSIVFDLIESQPFDVIVSADQLKAMEVTRLKEGLLTSKTNGETPLIVICESESAHQRNELAQQGFDRVVQLRMQPADLIKKINAVCNPRDWRKDDRYHIPGVGVAVHLADLTLEARLINLSKGGILVELAADRPEVLMQQQAAIDLKIQMKESMAGIEGLSCKLLRVEVVSWESAWVPQIMRVTFIFEGLGEGTLKKLEELMRMAKHDRLPIAAMVD